MVMQLSTGQTRLQRSQPTQSSSRTTGCSVALPSYTAGSMRTPSAVKVDALVRALVACHVTEVALDALVLVDGGHGAEAEVEVAVGADARHRRRR